MAVPGRGGALKSCSLGSLASELLNLLDRRRDSEVKHVAAGDPRSRLGLATPRCSGGAKWLRRIYVPIRAMWLS